MTKVWRPILWESETLSAPQCKFLGQHFMPVYLLLQSSFFVSALVNKIRIEEPAQTRAPKAKRKAKAAAAAAAPEGNSLANGPDADFPEEVRMLPKNFARRSLPATPPFSWRFQAIKVVWHEPRAQNFLIICWAGFLPAEAFFVKPRVYHFQS